VTKYQIVLAVTHVSFRRVPVLSVNLIIGL